MSDRQLKFGAILHGVGGQGQQNTWLDPEIPGDASVDVTWHVARAQQAEAAGFDLVFIADSQFITADSPPHFLSRLEPLTLLSAIAASTEKIGLVATITTSYTEPFHVARQVASLDLISRGRAGWNVVTSIDQGTATNYNRQDHLDYETRYARALEHVTVAQGLWDSYEDDAFPRDKEAGVFFDRTRQHELNHVGEYFSVAGPLNVERSPQGRPVIFQAGNSEEGRDLAATVGEGIFTHAHSFEEGQAFYAEMKERAAAKGRNPDEMVIMPALLPTIGDTDEEAHQLKEAREGAKDFTKQLADFSRAYGQHDFTQYDPDGPFPFEVGRVRRPRRAHRERQGRRGRPRAGPDPAGDRDLRRTSLPHRLRRLAADRRRRNRALVPRRRGGRLHVHGQRPQRVRPLHRRGAADPPRARPRLVGLPRRHPA